MSKPYIDTYENENGDIVVVYVKEIRPYETVEPECIVIDRSHVKEFCKSITKTFNETNRGNL